MEPLSSSPWHRAGWFALGCVLMVIAAFTVPFPIPTTPIVISALLAFARSSDKMRTRLVRGADRMSASSHALVRRLGGMLRAGFGR